MHVPTRRLSHHTAECTNTLCFIYGLTDFILFNARQAIKVASETQIHHFHHSKKRWICKKPIYSNPFSTVYLLTQEINKRK